MMALAFLLIVAAIAGTVLGMEGGPGQATLRRPTGLATWLTSGNWPAKIGAGLLVVGVGALLRYALINFDVSPSIKLGTGVLAAAVLGFASLLTHKGAAHRAVSLCLGGAAFGVAYLTAYSAFSLFGYVSDTTGLALLALTAIATGVFAITRSALSLALLAMVGAYMAPAFAVRDPGPQVIYGYYAAASALTFVMVMARGWRPLIHLSFLFTLAGSLFFAWTARYYTPQHFTVMGPFLLLLTALHVAMPVAEKGSARPGWIERMDLVYILTLPAVVVALSAVIAPTRFELATHLLWLSAIWFAAAAWLQLRGREGVAIHAVIGTLIAGFAAAARFAGLPWEMIALAFSVAALAIAVLRSPSRALHNALAGLVLLMGAVQVIGTIAPPEHAVAFANGRFIERILGAALLIVAGMLCRRARQTLDTVLLCVGIGWGVIAIGAELARWDLVSFALVLHWLLIAVAASLLFIPNKKLGDALAIPLVIGIAGTALFAAKSAPITAALISLMAAPLSLLAVALRSNATDKNSGGRVAAAIVVPFVKAIWAQQIAEAFSLEGGYFIATAAAAAAILTIGLGHLMSERSHGWLQPVSGIFGVAFACVLAVATLLDIDRHGWAIALELSCLAGLILLAVLKPRQTGEWIGPACIVGVAAVIQANLLRWLGSSGHLTVLDISHMKWPALISLLWAGIGAALTVTARKKASRPLWMGGAVLLVAAAVKLILLDFGSLGDLANILAVIAAGGMFLLVGWLAPMPPAAEAPPKPAQRKPSPQTGSTAGASASTAQTTAQPAAPAASNPQAGPASKEGLVMPDSYWKRPADGKRSADWKQPADENGEIIEDSSGSKLGWTIALIALIAILCVRCEHAAQSVIRDLFR